MMPLTVEVYRRLVSICLTVVSGMQAHHRVPLMGKATEDFAAYEGL
jgi:hypothetical protein